jgi:hypothetical protein
VLEQKKMQPVRRVADFFLNDPLPSCVKTYIDQRLAAYEQVLEMSGTISWMIRWTLPLLSGTSTFFLKPTSIWNSTG